MAKKNTPATSISRDTKMSMKPITDEEFLYGEVWRLHQEVTDAQALSSSKSPVSEGLHFEDVVDKKLAEKSFFDSDFDTSEAKDEKESARSHDHYQHSDQVSLPLSSSIEISLTGTSVSLDESFDLQNSSTSAVFGDQDDNDVNIDLLPLDFSSRLAELSSQAPMESAWSGYDGMTGHHVLSISVATSGYDLAFTDSHGHALNGEDSGLRTLQGEAIYLYTDTEHHSIVFGKTQSHVIIFSTYLQDIPSSTHDVDLWTILYQPLAHPDPLQPDESINLLNKLYVSVSTGGLDNLRDATAGQHLFIMTGNALEAFVITGLHPANQSTGAKPHSGDSVNISHAGEVTSVGSNNQMLDPPTYSKSGRVLKLAEGLTLTFVSGASEEFTGLNLSPTEADVESNIQFSGLIETQFARFVVSQLQPSKACTLKISALNTQLESGAQFVDGLISGDSHVSVSRVRISDQNGILLEDTNGSANVSYITVSFDSGSATVSGVKQGDQIEYFSESGFNRTVIMNVGSERADFDASFDIGDFSIHQYQSSTVEIGSKIIFEDSAPDAYLNQSVSIDDDALSGGNPGGLGDLEPDSVNVTGILAHSYGADGGSMAWLPIGAPAGFAYELGEDGALLVKQGEATVLTLNLNAETGEYSVIQGAAIQHMPGSDENTQEFTLSYQMVDGDGDMTDGRLLIQVNDDTPTVSSNLVVQIDDDALEGGNPGGLGDVDPDSVNVTGVLAHSYGADGGSMAWLSIGAPAGFAYELGEDGVLLVKQGEATVLTLSLNAETGEYSVIQGAAIQHMPGSDENTQEFTLSYQVVDGDGDMTDGRLLIQVNDDTPTVSSNLIVQIDDDALEGGNPGGLGDAEPETVSASGVLTHSYGADGGSMAWLPIGAPAGFAYELGEDGVLLVKQGEATVLTLSLNASTGEYNVIQGAAIQNLTGSDENTQEFTLSYQMVDGDGDMTDGRLLIQVNDDTPTVSSNLVVQIDDDALEGGNPGGLGDVDPDSVNVTGVLAHSYGADGGSMAWLSIGAPAGFAYELGEDGVLLVKQGEATVLTLSLNAETGEYSVIQGAAIQHMPGSDENTQEFTLSYQVVDGDGDMTDGRLLIQVNDDTPTVSSNLVVHIDDDALIGGNPGGLGDVDPDSVNVTGVLAHSYGADGGSMAWLPIGAPAGFAYELGEDGALLVKQGEATVLTLNLNAETGEYSVIQGAAIQHMPGSDENTQEFTLSYQVVEGDGDMTDGRLLIQVNDDTPTVSSNLVVHIDDDALIGGNPGGLGDVDPDSVNITGVLAHSYGADGGSMAWLAIGAPAGFAYELGEDGALLVKQGEATVLTLSLNHSTGEYNVIQGAAIQHMPGSDENTQEFTLSYQVVDGDGDMTDGRLLIQVNDDTPTVSNNLMIHLDDDALTGGLPGGEGDVAPDLQNVTGTLSHTFGADGPGQVEWVTDGAPLGFSYEQNGQDLLIRQADVLVITLTLDPVTGNYSTVQNAPIINVPGLNENNQDLALGYRVIDADGDAVHGLVNITVNDDTPHGSFNEINLLDDDALESGNPGGIGDISPDTAFATGNLDYGYGADGGSIAWLTTGAPQGFEYEAEGTSLLIKQGGTTVMTLTLDPDTAAYTVIQNQAIHHSPGLDENTQQFTVAYRVTDVDGDSADGEFFISVNDDTPMVSSNLVIHLDDDALTGGLPGGEGDVAPDLQNVTGTLSHSFGADGPGQVEWLTDGAPLGFSYEQNGQDLLIRQADVLVITLTLDPVTGNYSTVQNAPIMNEPGLNENNQFFELGYRVTDADGDATDGMVNLTVNDDTPHGSFNEINRLDDDALVNGNPGGIGDISPDTTYDTGNLDYGYGADGGSIAWLTTGAPEGFEYEASGTSLLIKQSGATVLTLTLDADTAAYTVIQNEAIQHHSGGHENTQEFTVAYRVSDGDADIANGEFFISVNDDTPIVSSNLEIILDDDAMTGGNPGGDGDVNPDTQNTAGTLSHSYGSDGGSIAWRSDGAPTGFTYEVSGDSLWIKQGSDTILTLTLNAETGDYVVQQQMSVHHAGDLQENEQLFSVNYELTDGDGDTAQGELTIRVNDDTPVILSIADLIYANTDNPTPGGTGIFSYSVGADQRSSYSASDSDFAMFSLVGQVGVNSITNSSVTWQSESSHALTYDFGFDYQPNPSSVLTSHATGTLSFDKDLGTYSISLSQPLEGMQILTTSRALSFIGYELESSVVDRTQPHVSVAQLSEQMYAQFTAVSEPGGGTGSNNLTATGVDANTNNYIAGEIFTQSHSWVSTSNLSNGVGGDTLQKGEVLDFDLFTANPLGHTDALPTGAATALFLKFDGISSEDFVVILKLSDVTTHVQTTRALVIDGSDILLHGNTLTSSYQIVLDNNDGAVVIEQNDYNLSGENYVITGAQVLTSTEGVTGSGIDFNTVIGAAGASTGSQSFGASTTDNDVIKISDIGVVTQSTATLDSHLDFNFAILDADGDATATQLLSVLMAGSASSLLETLN